MAGRGGSPGQRRPWPWQQRRVGGLEVDPNLRPGPGPPPAAGGGGPRAGGAMAGRGDPPRRKRRPSKPKPKPGQPDRRARFGGLDVTPQLTGPAVRASSAPPAAAGGGRPRTPGKAGGKAPETPARLQAQGPEEAAIPRTLPIDRENSYAGAPGPRPGSEAAAAKRPLSPGAGSRPAKRAVTVNPEEGDAQITGMRTSEQANAARWANAKSNGQIIQLSTPPDAAGAGDPVDKANPNDSDSDCVIVTPPEKPEERAKGQMQAQLADRQKAHKQRQQRELRAHEQRLGQPARAIKGKGSVSAADLLGNIIAAVTEHFTDLQHLQHQNDPNLNAEALGPLATLKGDSQIRSALKWLDISQGIQVVKGHAGLAGLAEVWSSFSCGFRYDKARTQLWVKPFLLGQWLNLLHHRDYEVRVVGHGVRSGRYDQLAKDPAGFNVAKSQHGAHGYGVYVSPFDAIPADYGRRSTQLPGAPVFPDGTFVLALLLTKPGAGTLGEPAHEGGGMKWFHLGSARPGYIGSKPGGGRPTAPPHRGRGSSGARHSLPAAMRALAARARTGGLINVTYQATKQMPKLPNGLRALRVPQGLVSSGATAGNNQGAPPLDAIVVRDSNVLLPLGRVVARE